MSAVFNRTGQMVSLRVKPDDKSDYSEFVPNNQRGNKLVLFDDVPLYWDAWDVMDYHLETRKELVTLKQPAKLIVNKSRV